MVALFIHHRRRKVGALSLGYLYGVYQHSGHRSHINLWMGANSLFLSILAWKLADMTNETADVMHISGESADVS